MSPLASGQITHDRCLVRLCQIRHSKERTISFPNECIHTQFPFQIALWEACKPIVVGFLCAQISSNGKMSFAVPVSHLRKQALHVTARDISHEPPKGKTNSETTLTAVASYLINGSSASSYWVPCDRSPHCLDYLDYAYQRYINPEVWPPKSPDLNHIILRLGRAREAGVKIQAYRQLKERLRLCWAHISQYRVAKVIPAFTKRLKGCIASRSGRFEPRLQWDEKMMEALVVTGMSCAQFTDQQWRLCCDKGMAKQSVLVRRNLSEIRTRKNLTTFGLQPVTTLFERGTECEYIHSNGNCPLFSNAVPGKVVRRISRKLFGLKARGHIFWITLYNSITCHLMLFRQNQLD